MPRPATSGAGVGGWGDTHMRSKTVRLFSRLTAKRQPPRQPRASTKPEGLSGLGIGRAGTMRGPGVLVPTLPRCHFPWPGRGSVDESRLLKITRLSIIPSAILRDRVFQGPAALQGQSNGARRAMDVPGCPRPGEHAQRPGPHRPVTQLRLPSHTSASCPTDAEG